MSVFLDLRPLRESPEFARLWVGSACSAVGSQFATFAAMFATWELTRSPFVVGLLGLARAVPLIALALAGTAVIDSLDRARLARLTTIGQLLATLGMAGAVWRDSAVGLIALVAISAGLSGLGMPARRALIPQLVPASRLTAAFALNSLSFQVAILLGPALAGLTTSAWRVEVCFLVDAASFVVALLGLRGLQGAGAPSGARGWSAAREGLVFATRRQVVLGALLFDLAATVLAMPMALFPVLNQERFDGNPTTLGLFLTAVAVGGVAGSLLSGRITRADRPGLVMTTCALTWGVALVVAGLAGDLWLVLTALGVAGLADTWSVTSRGALVQSYTPDALRGRVSALEHVVGTAGPEVGNFRAGIVGSFLGGGAAVAVGGLTCVVASGALYARIPGLRRYRLSAATQA